MLVFGAIGLAANLVGIAILLGDRAADLNLRAAFLEVVNDALGSVAVLVAAAVIATTGWLRADAVASLVIGALIVPRTLLLLRESVDVLLESTPRDLDLAAVREHLMAVPHVQRRPRPARQPGGHRPAGADRARRRRRLLLPRRPPRPMLDELQRCLAADFDVEHSTFQFEAATHADHEHLTHP